MRNLRQFVSAAADVFSGSGNQMAVNVAQWLRNAPLEPRNRTSENPPAINHLMTAIGALELHPLVRLLGDDVMDAPWTQGSFRMPPSFASRIAYVELLGPDGLFLSEGRRFGLYLQSPETFYPSHLHRAEEIYFILSGTAQWQADEVEFSAKPCGSLIHHPPLLSHATRTHSSPLLAIWAWQGDIGKESYRIIGND